MSTNTRTMQATPDQVWDVLADGWLYPVWVVGASRMREVDDTWPAAGSRLHHSVGVWPALLDDVTEVLGAEPGRHLRVRAHGWPAGAAQVDITLAPSASGPGATDVTIVEDAVAGPGALVPSFLRQPPLAWRNTETLRRLAYLAERRS